MSTEKGGAARGVTRDPLTAGAVVLAVTAFAGSFTHVQATAAQHSPPSTPLWLSWAIALMPELMVWLAVFKLRRAIRDRAAWLTVFTAGSFTLAANLAQAEPSPWGWVVAGWPAWAAVSSALMLKMGDQRPVQRRASAPGQERVKPQVSAPVTPVQEPAGLRSVKAPAEAVVDRSERVKELRGKGLTWAEVAAQVGCSVSTAKREWAA